ncbi:MAG TPA: hypothetical protein VEA81_00210 [Burkholderiaceae bacterium]|nr:hypothetical protein [Burkholderiaceae bacterium]
MLQAIQTAPPRRLVAVNEYGRPIGQDHWRARLTDAECESMRRLRDDGFTYTQLAEKFEVSKSAVADIVKFRRRAQTPVAWHRREERPARPVVRYDERIVRAAAFRVAIGEPFPQVCRDLGVPKTTGQSWLELNRYGFATLVATYREKFAGSPQLQLDFRAPRERAWRL